MVGKWRRWVFRGKIAMEDFGNIYIGKGREEEKREENKDG